LELWFWIWAVLAVALLAGEIFTAGFFMLPLGLGAAVAAVLALLGIALAWQWVAFVSVSLLAFLFLRRFASKITQKQPIKTGVDRLLGMTGVVIEAIEPLSTSGKVRVDREVWRAENSGGEPVPVGTPIVVDSVGGTHLVVRVKDPAD